MLPTGWPPLGGQLPEPVTATWIEPPVMPGAVQVPSSGTVKVVALMHWASVNTVVVPVQEPVPPPHEQGVQLRVSTVEPEKVCLSENPAGQGKLPDIQMQAPATKGAGAVGAQTFPALHPIPVTPPEQASPARPQSGGGSVLPPPPGVHGLTIAVGAAAE